MSLKRKRIAEEKNNNMSTILESYPSLTPILELSLLFRKKSKYVITLGIPDPKQTILIEFMINEIQEILASNHLFECYGFIKDNKYYCNVNIPGYSQYIHYCERAKELENQKRILERKYNINRQQILQIISGQIHKLEQQSMIEEFSRIIYDERDNSKYLDSALINVSSFDFDNILGKELFSYIDILINEILRRTNITIYLERNINSEYSGINFTLFLPSNN